MEISPSDVEEVCNDWVRLLTIVFAWSEESATAWARDHASTASGPLFLHESTSWYLLPAVITREVRRRTKALGELESKVDLALERFRKKMRSGVTDEEVGAIRSEIRAIFDAYVPPTDLAQR